MGAVSFFVDVSFDSNESFAERYEVFFKRLVSFLFQNQDVPMAFHFDGESVEWFEKNHAEFFQILRKLLDRKQIEILGGGFFNPILPLIFPMDRTGQIEKLTARLRQVTGKRPRGFFLFGSCWSETLIPGLSGCGFEYALLGSAAVPPKYRSRSPLVSGHLGKSLALIETLSVPVSGAESLRDALCGPAFPPGRPCMAVALDFSFFDFDAVFSFLKGGAPDIACALPGELVRSCRLFTKAHVPECGDGSALFNRMMYVSVLLNQLKGDKARKNLAREQLWFSQNGAFYTSESRELYQRAYRSLLSAERCVREFSDFRESVTAFDYDGDGFSDYLCQMGRFGACISPVGARIFELSAFRRFGDFCAGGGIFSTLVLTDDEFAAYRAGGRPEAVFGGVLFDELKFDGLKKDVTLAASGEFSPLGLTVSLKKKYVANPNGFMVQMIVRNESPLELRGNLVVESNFAQMHFGESRKSYSLEAISNDRKEIVGEGGIAPPMLMEDISYLKLTDGWSGTAFVFEPNENCGVVAATLQEDGGETTRASLCWRLALSPGIEIEKTVNFSIVPQKGRKD